MRVLGGTNRKDVYVMKKTGETGSATIEAVVSLSIFLFAFAAIYSIVNMCIVQAKIQEALNKSAKEISQYVYFYDKFNIDNAVNGINKNAQSAIGVLDSFQTVIQGGGQAVQQVGNLSQSVSITDITESIDSLNNLKDSTDALIKTLSEVKSNPTDYIKSFASLSASGLIDETKMELAAMLAKSMSKRHFEDMDLEQMGVKAGYDEGMDFSNSKLLNDDKQEVIYLVVVYELEVADWLPFNFGITVSQSAQTRGWIGNGK